MPKVGLGISKFKWLSQELPRAWVSPSLRAIELACHCFMDASWWHMQSMCVRWFGTNSNQCLAYKGVKAGKTLENCLPATTQQCHTGGIRRVAPTSLNKHSEQCIRTNETMLKKGHVKRHRLQSARVPRGPALVWSRCRLSLFMGMNLNERSNSWRRK